MSAHATLRDAILYFASFENCKDFMMQLRWADGVVKCPACGSTKVTWLAKQRVWKCYATHPKPRFSLKTGTILEDSPVALEKWLPAVWMLLNCKNGISSYQLHRDLGVTQKTAWFMLQRIRLAMQDTQTGGKLSGEVKVDETFIGGKARNMHAGKKAEKIHGRGPEGKTVVAAVLERGGKVRAKVVATRKKSDLQKLVRDNVEAGSSGYSDSLKSYDGLSDEYTHQVVDHAVEYVRENVPTNGMENFWSLLKRGINGTYVSVEPFHLCRYVDEQAFRFNNRHVDDAERFVLGIQQILGRRLTYKELIGKVEGEADHG